MTPSSRRKFLFFVSLYSVAILALLLITNGAKLGSWFSGVLLLFRPILIGLVLAYLLNPFFRFYERKLLSGVHPLSLRRALSLILTYLTLFLIVALVGLLILPQLFDSILTFAGNINDYSQTLLENYNRFVGWLNDSLSSVGIGQTTLSPLDAKDIEHYLTQTLLDTNRLIELLRPIATVGFLSGVISAVGNVVLVIADVIFSLFISLYLLSSKEKNYALVMRLRRALFGDTVNKVISKICTVADESFGSFLEGKIVDSLIIGILTYIVVSVFHIPYAMLVATIVGITNIVPVIGPIVGAVPTSVIILLTEPGKVIPFLIIVLVIQQIDGNIIGPKILGSSNGISSFCVLVAVTVMGNLWGFIGMVLGVPLFATVLALIDSFVEDRLKEMGVPSSTGNFYPADSMVDPNKDLEESSGRWIRNFEKRTFRIRKKLERKEYLFRSERILLSVYNFASRLSLVGTPSAETLSQYEAEETAEKGKKELQAKLSALENKHAK